MSDRYGRSRSGGGVPLPYRRPADAAPVPPDALSMIAALAQRGRQMQQQRMAGNTPQTPPVPMGSGGAPMPSAPQYISQPNLRIRGNAENTNQQTRQYAGQMSQMAQPPQPPTPTLPAPVDNNGVPYPGWDQLHPDVQRSIYENMGLPLPEPVPRTWERNASATYGNNNQTLAPAMPPPVPMSPPDLSGTQGMEDFAYLHPPEGWLEANDNDITRWTTLSLNGKKKQHEIYSNIAYAEANATPDYGDVNTTHTDPILGATIDQAKSDILASDPYGPAADYAPTTGGSTQMRDLFGRMIATNQAAEAQKLLPSGEGGVYMPGDTLPTVEINPETGFALEYDPEFTVAGVRVYEQPAPNWGGTEEQWYALPREQRAGLWRKWTSENTDSIVTEVLGMKPVQVALAILDKPASEVRGEMGSVAYYMATHNGERPPDDWNDMTSWVASMGDVADIGVDAFNWGTHKLGDKRDALTSVNMVSYLEEHPEMLPQIQAIYERAISLGASPDKAGQIVWDWFYEQQGFVAQLTAEGLWDPFLVLDAAGAAGSTITRKALRDAAEEAATGGITKTTAARIGLGDVLTAPRRGAEAVQGTVVRTAEELADLIPGVWWARSKSPETIARETAQQADEATETIQRTFTTGDASADAEMNFRRAKQEAADAQIRRDQAAAQRRAQSQAQQNTQRQTARTRANTPQQQPLTPEDAGVSRDLQNYAELDTILRNRRTAVNAPDEVATTPPTAPAPRPTVNTPSAEMFDGVAPLPPEADAALSRYDDMLVNDPAGFEAQVPQVDVPLRTTRIVESTGDDLYPARIQEYIDNPNQPSIGAEGPVEQNIIAVKVGDTLYLVEGKHRVAAAIIRGDESIPMRVIDATPTAMADEAATVADTGRIPAPESIGPVSQNSILNQDMPQAFWDEIEGRDQFARSLQSDETAQGFIDRVEHRVYLEDATLRHGGDVNDYAYSPHSKTSLQGAVQRLVFGTDQEADAARAILRRNVLAKNPQISQADFDRLEELRDIRQGNRAYSERTGVARPARIATEPAPTPSPAPKPERVQPTSPSAASPVPSLSSPELQNAVDRVAQATGRYGPDAPPPFPSYGDPNWSRLEEDIADGIMLPNDVQATKLRRKFYDMAKVQGDQEFRNIARWMSEERARIFGPESVSRSTQRRLNRGQNLGIANDPRAQAREMFQTTDQAADYVFGPLKRRAERRLGTTPDADLPVDVDVNTWIGKARVNGQITQKDWDTLNVRATIPTKRAQPSKGIAGEAKEYTFVDRFQETFAAKAEQARKSSGLDNLISKARKGQEVTDEQFDEALARFSDQLDGMTDEALTQTNTEFRKAILGDDATTRKRDLKRAAGKVKEVQNFQRANIMFSIVAGPRGYAQDMIDGAKRAIQFGESGSVKSVWRIQRRLMKWADEAGVDPEVAMGLESYARTGRKIPREYVSGSSARLQLEGKQTIWTEGLRKYNPVKLLAVPTLKRLRTTGDSAWRIAMHDNIYTRGLVEGRGAFMQRVRQHATRIGDQSLVGDMAGLGTYFSPDDVRRILDAHEITDMRLARSWAEQTDLAWKAAKEKVDRVYFTYKKTNADEQLSHIFMFHYFMTRYAGQQFGFLMTHPGFANAYANWWEHKSELQSAIMPDWMNAWVQWSLGNGMYAAANFDDFFFGFSGFFTAGEGGFFDETKFDEIMRNTNLFPAPLLQAAASAFGFSHKPTDLTGTGRLRNFVTGLVNEVRNTDAEWVPDALKETGITEDKWRTWEANVINYISGLVEDKTGFVEGNQLRDDIDAKRENVERHLIANFEEEHGPKYGPDGETILWDQKTLDEYQAAEDALDAGDYTNPDVEQAIDDWAATGFANEIAKTVAPFQAGVRSEAVDTDTAETSAFYEGESEDGSAAAMTSWRNLNSPEARAVVGGNEQYRALGTEDEQFVLEGVNQIISGDIPLGYSGQIGGEWYNAVDINAMSFDERMDLAMQWLRDIDEEDTYESIKDKQAEFRAANPEFDDFKQYQRWVNGETDADALANLTWLEGQEGTEFARAASEKRAEYQADGLSPEEIDKRMLQWVNSEEAYLAVMGYIYKGESALPAVDTTSIPAWRQEDSGGGSGSSEKTSGPPQTLREQLGPSPRTGHQFNNEYVAKAWSDDLQAARMSPRQIEQQLSLGLIKPETLAGMARSGQIDRQQVLNWVRDGTLLRFDLYGMAEVEGVPAGDIRFLVEDGYLAIDDVLDLIFDPTDQRITRLRRLNQARKYERENRPDTASSGGSGFLQEYLFQR